MKIIFMLILAALMTIAIGYAQFNLQRYTTAHSAGLLTRAILIVTGGAVGYLYAMQYPDDRVLSMLAFLIGLGMVHFPAAIILLVKQQRGSGKS